MNDRRLNEVACRRRRSHRPLQRCRIPRIGGSALSLVHTPEQIEYEDELHGPCDQRRDSNELMQRNKWKQKVIAEYCVTAWIPGETQQMHGHEDAIDAEESEPEV